MDTNWVIAGQREKLAPVPGEYYEIRDSRKGTFTGRVLSVNGEWADVERIEGEIRWRSTENRMFTGPHPDQVSIRAGLVYLIEIPAPTPAP